MQNSLFYSQLEWWSRIQDILICILDVKRPHLEQFYLTGEYFSFLKNLLTSLSKSKQLFVQTNFQISRHFNRLLPTGQQVSHEQIVCFIKPISLSSSLACFLLAFRINKSSIVLTGASRHYLKQTKLLTKKKTEKKVSYYCAHQVQTRFFLFSSHSRMIFCDSSKWTVACLASVKVPLWRKSHIFYWRHFKT